MGMDWVYRITKLPNILQGAEELWQQRARLRAHVECSSQMQHPMTDVEVLVAKAVLSPCRTGAEIFSELVSETIQQVYL